MNKFFIPIKVCLSTVLIVLLAGGLVRDAQAETGTQTDQLGSLVVTRSAPKAVDVGQKFWVVIQIENTGSQTAEFKFVERLGNAEFDQSQAVAVLVLDPGYGMPPAQTDHQGFNLWYYEWSVKLEPGQKTSLAYWLVVRAAGSYVISPARLELDGQTNKATSWTIEVGCMADGVCQNDTGENYMTCPDDCSSGAADYFCDGVQDGVLDPDCDIGYDPDWSADIPGQPTATNPLIPKGLTGICPWSSASLLLPLAALLMRSRRSRRG